jgi:hypothetical protein
MNKAAQHFVTARDLGQEFSPEEVDKFKWPRTRLQSAKRAGEPVSAQLPSGRRQQRWGDRVLGE